MIDLDMRITEANLSQPTFNLLREAGVERVRDLQKLDKKVLLRSRQGGKRELLELIRQTQLK